eukprot:GHVP01045293.1.p1 GENE.GHVP01045293.1~~GHVP01045293.1.p1  ORF type:complete len:111 (+),score=7.30 GHVP01045293.1:789-1121(+)
MQVANFFQKIMKRNRGLYDNLEVGCVRDSIYILFFDILWPFRRMSCSFLSFKVNLTSFRESQKLRIAWLAKLSKFHFCSITKITKAKNCLACQIVKIIPIIDPANFLCLR